MEVIYFIINLLSLFFGIVSTDFCVGSLNPCLKMVHVLRMVVWIWLRFGCGCSNFEQIGEWKDWIYLQILYLVRSDAVIWICATCRDLVQERQWHGIASPAVNLSYGLQFPTICLLWVGKWQWWMLCLLGDLVYWLSLQLKWSIWTRFSDLYSCSIKFWLMTFMHDFGWFVHGVRMIHQFDSEAVRPLLILNMWVCLNSRTKWFLQIRKLGICLQQLQVLHLSDSVIWNLNFVIYINLKVNLWRSCKSETSRVRSPYLPRHLCGLY